MSMFVRGKQTESTQRDSRDSLALDASTDIRPIGSSLRAPINLPDGAFDIGLFLYTTLSHTKTPPTFRVSEWIRISKVRRKRFS